MLLSLNVIQPSPKPLRSSWDEDKMNELAQSIKEQGLIVPIKVRPVNGEYEVVYGHRRVEAARRAGLTELECFVEGLDDDESQWQALTENVIREDMSAIDIARAIQGRRDAGYSKKEIAQRMGWSEDRVRAHLAISNAPEEVRKAMKAGCRQPALTERHFSRTAPLSHTPSIRARLLKKAAEEELSTRQVENIAKSIATAKSDARREFLLNIPYHPSLHDAKEVKRREARYGDYDPLIKETTPPADQEWHDLPEVKQIINTTKAWRKELVEFREATNLGKLAPEAKQFIAHQLKPFAQELHEWIRRLENDSPES